MKKQKKLDDATEELLDSRFHIMESDQNIPIDQKFRLILENSPESLTKIRTLACEILKKTGCDRTTASDIILCIDEALANAIRYGQSMDKEDNKVTFTWWIDKDHIYFQIVDRGIGFSPDLENWRPPGDDQEKGRGIYIMKQLLTRIEYEDTGIGTKVTLCKALNE